LTGHSGGGFVALEESSSSWLGGLAMTLCPSTARDSQGRIQVWSTSDGFTGIAHLRQDAPNVDGWSAWASEPGVAPRADPVVVANADGHLEAFVADGTNDELAHMFRNPGQDTWSSWLSLGDANGNDVESAPAVARNGLVPEVGRLEVFTKDAGGKLWHIWQTRASNGWSGWASLDRPKGGTLFTRVSVAGDPAVGVNGLFGPTGRLEVFVRGTDDALWHRWQSDATGAWSTKWDSLGHPAGVDVAGDPVVAQNADGRLEVFVEGGDEQLWHIWQVANPPRWSSWERMPRLDADIDDVKPAVALNGVQIGSFLPGRLEVFIPDEDGVMNHCWQLEPNGSTGWSAWASLGTPSDRFFSIGDPAAVQNQNGRLEVFAHAQEAGSATNDRVFHIRQAPSGAWSQWEDLGAVPA
jgi:hypothetical protein